MNVNPAFDIAFVSSSFFWQYISVLLFLQKYKYVRSVHISLLSYCTAAIVLFFVALDGKSNVNLGISKLGNSISWGLCWCLLEVVLVLDFSTLDWIISRQHNPYWPEQYKWLHFILTAKVSAFIKTSSLWWLPNKVCWGPPPADKTQNYLPLDINLVFLGHKVLLLLNYFSFFYIISIFKLVFIFLSSWILIILLLGF